MRPCHKQITQTLCYKEIVLDGIPRYSCILSQAPCCPVFPSPNLSRYLQQAITQGKMFDRTHKFPLLTFICPALRLLEKWWTLENEIQEMLLLDRSNVSMKLTLLQRHKESLAVERNGWWSLSFLGQFLEALWELARLKWTTAMVCMCSIDESLGHVTTYSRVPLYEAGRL